jgi:simple sugar transport system substrate-binding protein
MVEDNSAWAATSSAVVGEACVRALALAGVETDQQVVVPPTLISRQMPIDKGIRNMDDLVAKLPQFSKADVFMAVWIPEPKR